MPAIRSAVARAASTSSITPPAPVRMSTCTAPAPLATAALITDAATSAGEGTVPVASRSSRSRRSPGARRVGWAMTAIPTSRTWRTKRPSGSSARKPGIAWSVSIVPPVCAWACPPIDAMLTPRDAARGAATMAVVSPTPPVDWGSPVGPRLASSRRSPEATRVWASARVWTRSMPWRQATMHHADMRASEAVPSSHARTKASTLAASTGSPRRLRSMSSTGASGAAMIDGDSTPAGVAEGAHRTPADPLRTAARVAPCFAP